MKVTTSQFAVMEREISAAEANRKFSELIRAVREDGSSYVVTSHGRPVAKITPVESEGRADAARVAAFRVLMKRLKSQKAKDIGRWSRDEVYEDDA